MSRALGFWVSSCKWFEAPVLWGLKQPMSSASSLEHTNYNYRLQQTKGLNSSTIGFRV